MALNKVERQSLWRQQNPDKVAEYKRRYRFNHPEKVKKMNSIYKFRNRQKIREQTKRYRERHQEEKAQYNKLWNLLNITKRNAEALVKGIPMGSICELCPEDDVTTEGLQRHHPDYAYPEIFVTVCPSCHKYAERNLEVILCLN